jgi:hypothetical protein
MYVACRSGRNNKNVTEYEVNLTASGEDALAASVPSREKKHCKRPETAYSF